MAGWIGDTWVGYPWVHIMWFMFKYVGVVQQSGYNGETKQHGEHFSEAIAPFRKFLLEDLEEGDEKESATRYTLKDTRGKAAWLNRRWTQNKYSQANSDGCHGGENQDGFHDGSHRQLVLHKVDSEWKCNYRLVNNDGHSDLRQAIHLCNQSQC